MFVLEIAEIDFDDDDDKMIGSLRFMTYQQAIDMIEKQFFVVWEGEIYRFEKNGDDGKYLIELPIDAQGYPIVARIRCDDN